MKRLAVSGDGEVVRLGNAAENPKVKVGPRANARWVWKPQSKVLIQEVLSFRVLGESRKILWKFLCGKAMINFGP